ncbi:agmatinase [Candidatus Neomarinimicrobiota bacterium]
MRLIQRKKSFLGMNPKYHDSRVLIQPVAYDRNMSWHKGAKHGPMAILEASLRLEEYDLETDVALTDLCIYTDRAIKSNSSEEQLTAHLRKVIQRHLRNGKYVCTLGGSHSVSIGPILAHNDHFKDFSVLQVDAHTDFRSRYMGSRYNHACVMNILKQEGISIIQVGISSHSLSEKDKINSARIVYSKDIHNKEQWISSVISLCTNNVYVTFDVDAFDPSIMPSTGTPEPGGITWNDACTLVRELSLQRNIVGFDMVELCPIKKNWAPDFMIAKLVMKFFVYQYDKLR